MPKSKTLFQYLENSEHKDNEALVFGDETLTYSDLYFSSKQLAANLMRLCDVKPGDKIAILMPNRPEFVIGFFAASLIGAVVVPISTRIRELELQFILAHCEAKVLLAVTKFDGNDYLSTFTKIRPELPDLRHIYVLDESPDPAFEDFSRLASPVDLEALEGEFESLQKQQTETSTCLMLYTSGTTGSPKGVMLSPRNITDTLARINKKVKADASDRYLLVVPVTSSLGCVTTLLRALSAGSCIVLMETFKAKNVLRVIEEQKVTVHVGVPTMFILELLEMQKGISPVNLSSLKQAFISGSECPVNIMEKIETQMNCRVMIGYGLTETTSYITVTNPDDPFLTRISTVGSPIPGEEFRIIDENGTDVTGKSGEILVRGASVMSGYFKEPGKTAETIDQDGWLHTGDIGLFDDERNLIFQGRKKDLVIRGGFNIYPSEIESFLITHPKVERAALIGIPDSVLGERSVACVIPSPDCEVTAEEIREFCSSQLTDYKVPDYIYFFNDFPLTHNAKVKKNELRSKLVGKIPMR